MKQNLIMDIVQGRQILLMERLVYKNYGNKAKNFIFTKDFTGKNR